MGKISKNILLLFILFIAELSTCMVFFGYNGNNNGSSNFGELDDQPMVKSSSPIVTTPLLIAWSDDYFEATFSVTNNWVEGGQHTFRVYAYLDFVRSDTNLNGGNRFHDLDDGKLKGPFSWLPVDPDPYETIPFDDEMDPYEGFMGSKRKRIFTHEGQLTSFGPYLFTASCNNPLAPDNSPGEIYFVIQTLWRKDSLIPFTNLYWATYKWETYIFSLDLGLRNIRIYDDDRNPPIIPETSISTPFMFEPIQMQYLIPDSMDEFPVEVCAYDEGEGLYNKITFDGVDIYPGIKIGEELIEWGGVFEDDVIAEWYEYNVTNDFTPGLHNVELKVWDKDNDGWIGDSLSASHDVEFYVVDDDVMEPNVNFLNNWMIMDCDDYLEIRLKASDPSGISSVYAICNGITYSSEYETPEGVFCINVTNPKTLGIHSVDIHVWDNDDDGWGEDRNEFKATKDFTVEDDDTIPPEILAINYPSEVGIFDTDFNITLSMYDVSGISEVHCYIKLLDDSEEEFVIFTDTQFPDDATLSKIYTIPMTNAEYSLYEEDFEVFFIIKDNDGDRDNDFSSTDPYSVIIRSDDDFTPPEIIIIPFSYENFSWQVMIIDDDGEIDSKATAHYKVIDQNFNIILEGEILEELYFEVIQLPFKLGIYKLLVDATNNDNDRENDEEVSHYEEVIEISLYHMYYNVDWQLEQLKSYIDDNLCHRLSCCLIWKLTKAQAQLHKAFALVEEGKVTCGLFHDFIAKIFVRFSEIKVEILNKFHRIDDGTADYIIDTLHNIRNNIVLLMGASTGSEQAYEIARIEVELLNLSDFIEERIPCCTGKYLRNKVYCASKMLEIALFKISMDEDIECILRCAQWKLQHVICKINWFLRKGRISEDLANYLIKEILRIIELIEYLIIGDDDTTGPNISITYVGAGHDKDPGVWHVIVEDLESGLDDIQILIDGNVYLHEQGLNGEISKSYDVPVPNSWGYHTVTIIAKNNDKDTLNDQETSTDEMTTLIEIYIPPPPPPPPPPM